MKCSSCNQEINQKANQVTIYVNGLNLHIECAIELRQQNEYDTFIAQAITIKRKQEAKNKRFIKGLGYV